MSDKSFRIDSEEALVAAIGEPIEYVRGKLMSELNPAMREFIAVAPLAFVATVDEDGLPDISPKGDPAGFVRVEPDGSLLIPERPGNRLAFGFRSIMRNGRVGLIFIAPHQTETLRIKGRASLHADPEILESMTVNGKPALMYTRVEVEETFFHCGKALIRSHLWQPDKWPEKQRCIAARGLMTKELQSDEQAKETEMRLGIAYKMQLY